MAPEDKLYEAFTKLILFHIEQTKAYAKILDTLLENVDKPDNIEYTWDIMGKASN